MYPNFYDKEYILTNIIALHFNDPKLGDVVVFKSPENPDKDFIKRVIGTPGDTILIKNGSVFINGKLIDEGAYLSSSVKTNPGQFVREDLEVKTPEDEYFVLGDNRSNSSDSREWGFVPKKYIVGKSFFVYWPPQAVGFVKNPYD